MRIIKKEPENYLKVEVVEIREPLVEDFLKAEKIAGNDTGFEYALALLSQIAVFDGKKYPYEELKKLRSRDFLELADAFRDLGLEELGKALSSSQEKQASL